MTDEQSIIDQGRTLEAKSLAAEHVKNLSPKQFSAAYDCVELSVYYTTQSGEHRLMGRHMRLPRNLALRMMQFLMNAEG